MISRRHLLAGAAASTALPARAAPPRRVLFLGNSFTREHGIPGRVARFAADAGLPLETSAHTRDGAHLWDLLIEKSPPEYLLDHGNPDLVVLQDHSTVALNQTTRGRSVFSIQRFALYHKPLILFATWARRTEHPIYRRSGMPAGPSEMAAEVHAHYRDAARKVGATVAPVGRRWDHAIAEGYDLHARDGYHANELGAHLTALVLAHSLNIPLPDEPLAEIAATTPT